DLPNGIISALLENEATFEVWVTWDGPVGSSWQRIFDFGTSDGGEDASTGAPGSFYIFLTPRSGDDTMRFGNNHPDPAQNETWIETTTLTSGSQQHVAVVWDGPNQSATIYLNGTAVATGTGFTYPLTSITDNNNWLGRAQWNDPMFVGNFNEFRIYNAPLSGSEVAASYAAGPDAVIPQVRAYGPVPASGEDYVDAHGLLTWQEPADVDLLGYDLYLGTDANGVALPRVGADLATNSFDLDDLAEPLLPDTYYYWRVNVQDANEGGDPTVYAGRLWRFKTAPAVPVVTLDPADTGVGLGEDAVMTCEAVDLGGGVVNYQWFRVAEGGDIPVSDIGPDQNVLMIPAVTLDDEGSYYCQVSNVAGAVDSEVARLDVQLGLIHRYDFTNDPNDRVGDADGILINGSGNARFENGQLVLGNTGQVSSALNGDYVDLPNGMISAMGPEVTLEVWATFSGDPWWARLFVFGTSNDGEITPGEASTSAGSSPYIFLAPRGDKGAICLEYVSPSPRALRRLVDPINRWPDVGSTVFFAVTWNETTGKVRLYRNGEFLREGDIHFKLADLPDVNNWLGRSQFGTDAYFQGSYDEFRVYDMALPDETILAHYQAGPDELDPETFCDDAPAGDLTGDCVVDLEDLAAL
ncbi:MAG TPA: hypothetical protein ENO14_02210, partial [Chromatiales bacterium]|nr:hypothetical protein [Chromatiales bacterium]